MSAAWVIAPFSSLFQPCRASLLNLSLYSIVQACDRIYDCIKCIKVYPGIPRYVVH
ncbi:hypothetical protein M758_10G150800 [Ceratodon purpureus]|uniref:Uncharacterized protein n=1 Tax=Ceratodon purpureus TaxID=3225 RepID=A0A8T0GPC2_CERPU|nr:hypothetical protein KC19_10G155800 [Ceratodon purpureus]KAG0604175.1 hypothetical protein M758_10G150800 [Ceratodon purpureus]